MFETVTAIALVLGPSMVAYAIYAIWVSRKYPMYVEDEKKRK